MTFAQAGQKVGTSRNFALTVTTSGQTRHGIVSSATRQWQCVVQGQGMNISGHVLQLVRRNMLIETRGLILLSAAHCKLFWSTLP